MENGGHRHYPIQAESTELDAALQPLTQRDVDVVSALTNFAERVKAVEANIDHLTCPICKDLLYEPLLTRCGHSFCDTCYFLHLKSGPTQVGTLDNSSVATFYTSCPICRKADIYAFPNYAIRGLLLSMFPREYAKRAKEVLHESVRREMLPEIREKVRQELVAEQRVMQQQSPPQNNSPADRPRLLPVNMSKWRQFLFCMFYYIDNNRDEHRMSWYDFSRGHNLINDPSGTVRTPHGFLGHVLIHNLVSFGCFRALAIVLFIVYVKLNSSSVYIKF